MSSVPRTEPRRRLRGPGGWSLRTRLIAAVLALTALISLAIGAVSTVAMRQFLVGRLDDQLATAAARVGPERGGRGDRPAPDDFPPGQPAGTLSARIADGEVTRAQIFRPDAQPSRQELPAAQYPVLTGLPAGAGPVTRELGEDGSYRLVAVPTGSGEVVVTGLPLADVERVVWWMVAVEIALAVLGLLVAGTAGTAIVGGALRPLRRMAATATGVSELPLDRGEVALSVRVPERDTDPRTEVGQVGAALNRMLEHVAAALRARQASETRVRQFVADASHELRTPLAAIRGYAELTRHGREEVPAQTRARARAHRGREPADEQPRRRPAPAGATGLRPPPRGRAGGPDRAGDRRRRRRARGRTAPPVAAGGARRGGAHRGATGRACTRWWRTC